MTRVAPSRGPRLVFVTDSRSGDGDGRYAWRLDAGNNRPLGRGVGVYQSLDECRRWLDALHRGIARVSAGDFSNALTFDYVDGLWSWRVTCDGEPAAVSMRTYLRRFECRRAASQFVEALSTTSSWDAKVRVVRAGVLGRFGETLGSAEAS